MRQSLRVAYSAAAGLLVLSGCGGDTPTTEPRVNAREAGQAISATRAAMGGSRSGTGLAFTSTTCSTSAMPPASDLYLSPNPVQITLGSSDVTVAPAGPCAGLYSYSFWTTGNQNIATISGPATGRSTTVHGVNFGSTNVTVVVFRPYPNQTQSLGELIATVNTVFPYSVGISGPTQVPMYSSNQYVANVNNGTPPNAGTPPYDYKWRVQQRLSSSHAWGPWSNYYDSGTQNYTYTGVTSCGVDWNHLQVLVTDATGKTVSNDIYINITNPC